MELKDVGVFFWKGNLNNLQNPWRRFFCLEFRFGIFLQMCILSFFLLVKSTGMKKGPRYQQTNLYLDVFPWDQPSSKKAPPPEHFDSTQRWSSEKSKLFGFILFSKGFYHVFFPVLVSIMFFLFPTLFPVFVFQFAATTSFFWDRWSIYVGNFSRKRQIPRSILPPGTSLREACRLALLFGGGGVDPAMKTGP